MLLPAMAATSFAGHFTGAYSDAKAEAAKLGKPLLIDFSTEW
jgi:hypothetical protein